MPRRIALLIANQSFAEGSGFAPLRGPHNDVEALARVLSDPKLGAFELAGPPLIDAARAKIVDAIERMLVGAGRDDTVLIHYSGHGKPDPKGRLHFATADSHEDYLRGTAIRASELHEMAAESRCRAIVLTLDCCYAGAIGKVMGASLRGKTADQLQQQLRGETADQMQQQLRETVREARGFFILTSSTGWQTSEEVESEIDGKVMGRFTRALVERIESGHLHHRGDVYFSDLADHLHGAFPGQDVRRFIADGEGDPLIAHGAAGEGVVERRRARLIEWLTAAAIPGTAFGEAFQAAAGEGRPDLVSLSAQLLDNPEMTGKEFAAAWKRATQRRASKPAVNAPRKAKVRQNAPLTARDSVRQSPPTPVVSPPTPVVSPPTPVITPRTHAKNEVWPPRTPFVVWRDTIPGLPDDLCPEMVTLPSGSFMRIPFENEWRSGGWIVPGRTVAVGAFAIGRYTVTFGEWKQAIAAGAPLSEPFDAGWGRDRRPVIDVESQIEEYIAWLNAALRMGGFPGTYRLPTEAEWEYACRAGTTTDYSFGDTISIDQANFAGGYQFGKRRQVLNKTAPVGSFPANQFGLHEMHGNVWELVQDKYRSYEEYRAYAAAPPGTHNTTAVLRGGSWKQASNHIRSASRYYRGSHSTSHSPGQSVGFRLARSFVTS